MCNKESVFLFFIVSLDTILLFLSEVFCDFDGDGCKQNSFWDVDTICIFRILFYVIIPS